MPFIASGGLTEEGTSRTIEVDGWVPFSTGERTKDSKMTVHYHDIGEGEPILFLHPYGPGTTAWISWYKVVGEFAKHYRCILYDMPNFTKTGPLIYGGDIGQHEVQAQIGCDLLDALGIESAHWVGHSQGGQSALIAGIVHPDRVRKFVMGSGHVNTGGDATLFENRPTDGSRATGIASRNPTTENVRDYLSLMINDDSLVTDELIEYIQYWHTKSPELAEARDKSKRAPHRWEEELRNIKKEVLLIWGRFDRVCAYEIGLNVLNHIPTSRFILLPNAGHWLPFSKPAEYTAHVLSFLRGYEVYELAEEKAKEAAAI